MPRYILLLVLLALTGCGSGETSYRYRMTVYIETPSGEVKSGSSVIEVTSRNESSLTKFLLHSGNCGPRRSVPMSQSLRGEAVEINLGRDRVVYALLKSPSGIGAEKFATAAFQSKLSSLNCSDWADEQKRVRIFRRQSAPAILANRPRRNDGMAIIFPTIVHFSDPQDKRTLRVVDPHSLDRTFGPGYRLQLVTIQITDDALPAATEIGLSRRLRWLETFKGYIDPYAQPSDIRKPRGVLTDLAFRTPHP